MICIKDSKTLIKAYDVPPVLGASGSERVDLRHSDEPRGVVVEGLDDWQYGMQPDATMQSGEGWE